MKTTIKQKLIAGILKMGGKPVDTGSRKYEAFEIQEQHPGRCFFVGKSGALRIGRTSSSSVSIGGGGSLGTALYRQFLSVGETELYIQSHQPKAA